MLSTATYHCVLLASQQLDTHSKGRKIIPKTRKNSRMIPEISEKVRLAIKRQKLARNIKKMMKIFDFSQFFGNETNIWISCQTMKTDDFDLGQKVKILNFFIKNDEFTGSKGFFYMKSGLKVKRRRKKRVKSREKNFKIFFVQPLLLGGMKFH